MAPAGEEIQGRREWGPAFHRFPRVIYTPSAELWKLGRKAPSTGSADSCSLPEEQGLHRLRTDGLESIPLSTAMNRQLVGLS